MFETEPNWSEYPDRREKWNRGQLMFLGGFWESAGGMGISKAEGRKGRWEYQPYMNYGANDRALIEALIKVYGGTFVLGTNSWEWQIAGKEAINLAGVMTGARVSVYREKYFAAMLDFGQTTTEDQKDGVYQRMMSYSRSRRYPRSDEYRDWVGVPEFVAGVMQATASVYWVRHQRRSGDHLIYRNRTVTEIFGG